MPTEEVIQAGEEVPTEGEMPTEAELSDQFFSQLFDGYKQDIQESASIGESEIGKIYWIKTSFLKKCPYKKLRFPLEFSFCNVFP